jgi:predicted  nucleic acid-binding Zn-ribbon protein
MSYIKVDSISFYAGKEVVDEYGRSLGWLVSIHSDVEGYVNYIDVKIVDRNIERVEAERIKVKDGKLIIIPKWKHFSMRVIESLDRAYRRRRALETIAQNNEIPSEVIESMRKKLLEEIKRLKVKAEEARGLLKARIRELEDEALKVASSIASLQVLYFAGEIDDKGYTQSINHLRRLREAIMEEKSDAKKVLDRLEKTLEAAMSSLERAPVKQQKIQQEHEEKVPQTHTATGSISAPSSKQSETIFVKVEEG